MGELTEIPNVENDKKIIYLSGSKRFKEFVEAVLKYEESVFILGEWKKLKLNDFEVSVEWKWKTRNAKKDNIIIRKAVKIKLVFWKVTGINRSSGKCYLNPFNEMKVVDVDLIKLFNKYVINCDRRCDWCEKNNHIECRVDECMCYLACKEIGIIIESSG